jgi:peptide-methionine (S)-S-oxide reductase
MKTKRKIKKTPKMKRNDIFAHIALALVYGCLLSSYAWGETMPVKTEKATFAAGCFWGVEKVFGATNGVTSTQVGYTGGIIKNPSYEQVCTGRTGHAEAIEIEYDPSKVSYEELLEVFFRNHDSTTLNRQGNDIGTQYRSAIFYHSPAQEKVARHAVDVLARAKIFKDPITTTLEPASEFYTAEEYHQKYLKKNPLGYCHIQLQSAKIGEALKKARG